MLPDESEMPPSVRMYVGIWRPGMVPPMGATGVMIVTFRVVAAVSHVQIALDPQLSRAEDPS